MHAKTQRILKSAEANLSSEYISGRILIVLKAESALLYAEHSFLTELRLDKVGAPKKLVDLFLQRIQEIEAEIELKEAEIRSARAIALGISNIVAE